MALWLLFQVFGVTNSDEIDKKIISGQDTIKLLTVHSRILRLLKVSKSGPDISF